MDPHQHLAILVGGGPAPAINSFEYLIDTELPPIVFGVET
jgi:hypothetical protein